MLNARIFLRLFAAGYFAFLGCCDIATADELIVYDFQGYRARVSGRIDDPRNWSPDQTPDRIEWISAYDGRMWGTDTNNFAAMWVDRARAAELTEPWTCFEAPIGDPVQFPSRTRVMGRTPQFGWHGFCHLVVDIFLDGDMQWLHFWPTIRTGQQIFGFSIDPEEQFATETNRPGQRQVAAVADWNHFNFVADVGTIEQDLWVYAPGTTDAGDGGSVGRVSDSSQQRDTATVPQHRWVYTVRADDSTLIYSVRTRHTNDGFEARLPKAPADLLGVYSDVDRIALTPFRDHTELGPWPQGKVIYENDRPVDRLRRQWQTRGASLVGSASIGFVMLAACFWFHILYLRSIQS